MLLGPICICTSIRTNSKKSPLFSSVVSTLNEIQKWKLSLGWVLKRYDRANLAAVSDNQLCRNGLLLLSSLPQTRTLFQHLIRKICKPGCQTWILPVSYHNLLFLPSFLLSIPKLLPLHDLLMTLIYPRSHCFLPYVYISFLVFDRRLLSRTASSDLLYFSLRVNISDISLLCRSLIYTNEYTGSTHIASGWLNGGSKKLGKWGKYLN